jgi:2-polyprenyl-3-methyl-5-hydroxy-6-metoxy-1,4-benzoquinol methylase
VAPGFFARAGDLFFNGLAVNFIKLDPPGTHCTNEALRDIVKQVQPRTFIDVGCGSGNISKLLCSLGLRGIGIDFSKLAIATSAITLRPEIEAGWYRLVEGDARDLGSEIPPADFGISFMVMEHVHDDIAFVRHVSAFVVPNGYVAICVPGRKDCWTFEDETVGHLRRYERADLKRVLEAGGLHDVKVWSVAVPIANILLRAGSWLVKRSPEAAKLARNQREQTETSGIREIPWKTVFPSWARFILNRHALYPLLLLQRLFYPTGLGVTMLGFGRVSVPPAQTVD